jgi:hypothetical protein
MPIIRYLKDKAFDRETILDMSATFEKACNQLGVTDTSDPFAERVAAKIIELHQRGVRNPTAMFFLAMQELGKADKHSAH